MSEERGDEKEDEVKCKLKKGKEDWQECIGGMMRITSSHLLITSVPYDIT